VMDHVLVYSVRLIFSVKGCVICANVIDVQILIVVYT
jgi:hypothetical protein